MFRIDNDFVIDATITGGPARSVCLHVMTEVREVTFKLMCVCVSVCIFNRYINHSCSPNCITEVVTVEKENKIIISSCRRIQRGEEVSSTQINKLFVFV